MATSTPWGPSQQSTVHARGIVEYSCAGHGGFHLSKLRNAEVHPAWRKAKGWYEEDCDWAIVVMTFSGVFPAETVKTARDAAKRWNPDGYTAVTGEPVTAAESCVIRDREARIKYALAWIAIAAWGDWHSKVPSGMVGVLAKVGGRDSKGPEKYFLVPAAEYDARGECSLGCIVDPARHAEAAPLIGF